jgi:hypothetical protein
LEDELEVVLDAIDRSAFIQGLVGLADDLESHGEVLWEDLLKYEMAVYDAQWACVMGSDEASIHGVASTLRCDL